MKKINFIKLVPQAQLPHRAHEDDAGFDLAAVSTVEIAPGDRALIPTGLKMEMPVGLEAQVRPRSGLALKHGVTVLNAPGTIDAGYRGELGVILINHGADRFKVEPGMRVAQLVFATVAKVEISEAATLEGSERGGGGFGSSGL